jgi:uncharacterized protein with NRDE domain
LYDKFQINVPQPRVMAIGVSWDLVARKFAMCLILVAWQAHPAFPLVVAANRDEFHQRPSAAAGPWPEAPAVFGGRDLEAGGTWLGVREGGRFAAVTNVREPGVPQGRLSRGALPRDYLLGAATPAAFATAIQAEAYSGFNLLLADGGELWWCSNRGGAPRRLEPGVFGLSNHLLDTPWPKVAKAKLRFTQALPVLPAFQPFFELLADPEPAADEDLPRTGVPLAWERLLSSVFIQGETYGTRASTVVTRDLDGVFRMEERLFGPA